MGNFRRALILGGLALVGGTAQAQNQSLPSNSVFAIVGARIEIGDGRVLEKGTVVIRDGLITGVGVTLSVPLDAEIIAGEGLIVYPGFLDGMTGKGLQLPDPQPNQDTPPDFAAVAPASMREGNRKGVRPELCAGDYFNTADEMLKMARQSGFTTALVLPTGGLINGVGALINLSGLPRRESIVLPRAAMNFTFSAGGRGGGYPSSLMGAIALTRQTLLDAQYEKTVQTAFDNGNSRRPPADEGLLALQPVLDGALPALYDADTENEIVRALRVGDEFKLKLMLDGGLEAWKLAPLLAKRQIPVLVSLNFGDEPGAKKSALPAAGPGVFPRRGGGRPPTPPSGAPSGTPPAPVPPKAQPDADKEDATTPGTLPGQANKDPRDTANAAQKDEELDEDAETPKAAMRERHRKWEEKVANAGKLQQAGVPFAFTTKGLRNPADFLDNVRRAIKSGLPRAAALRALTLDAAKIFGVDRQMGSVESGKTAALVVMQGDFADAKSKVRYLFIDRKKFDLEKDVAPVAPASRPRFGEDDDGHE